MHPVSNRKFLSTSGKLSHSPERVKSFVGGCATQTCICGNLKKCLKSRLMKFFPIPLLIFEVTVGTVDRRFNEKPGRTA
jgi:hypothetical protein